MTINHADQLAQWWETAEKGSPRPGDTIITNLGGGEYLIGPASEYWSGREQYVDIRILARAPKPKPAWHDAVAVTATATDELGDEITAVWVREGDELWRSDEGGMVLRDDLRDVTPLIEAKVTGEARERVWRFIQKYTGEDDRHRPDYDAEIDGYITAALGLETA